MAISWKKQDVVNRVQEALKATQQPQAQAQPNQIINQLLEKARQSKGQVPPAEM